MTDLPTHRIVINEMTNEELDRFLESVRERRLAPVRIYKEALALKARVAEEKAIAKLDKQIHMLDKEIVSLDKAIAKVEKRVLNIKAIKLEVEGLAAYETSGHAGTVSGSERAESNQRSDSVHLRSEQGDEPESCADGDDDRPDVEHPE